jgi:hypothetical protein
MTYYMKKTLLIVTMGLAVTATVFAQGTDPNAIITTNMGALYVGADAIIYNKGGILAKAQSAINIQGTGKIITTGNFVQDATTTAFLVDGNGQAVSTGTFVFRDTYYDATNATTIANTARKRKITTSNNATTHNRGTQYVAFPNILLETNDTVVLTAYMGMDARSIKRTGTGVLLLASEAIGGTVWDASLRLPTATATDVPAGIVAIERWVRSYRDAGGMFPFASPYTNQRSGYFAGNWVRKPLPNPAEYTDYPLANGADGAGVIYPFFYVVNAQEPFEVGRPYLIKPQAAGFNYANIDFVLTDNVATIGSGVGGGYDNSNHDKNKFLFNGNPYNLGWQAEQIVTDQPLYNKNLPSSNSTHKFIVIGNSYSAPISVEKLNAYIGATTTQPAIYTTMYVFPAGSQSYYSFNRKDPGVNAWDIAHIPSQSVFMLEHRAGKKGGQFTIDRSLVEHSKRSNNILAGENGLLPPPPPPAPSARQRAVSDVVKPNLLRFAVSPADNESVYDLTAVFVREDAAIGSDKYDMAKTYNLDSQSFMLFMTDANASKQQQMGVPAETESVNMSFRPTNKLGTVNYTLTASNVENMQTEAVQLQDVQTGIFQDLRLNPVYEFVAEADDAMNRFVVHFVPVMTTPEVTTGIANDGTEKGIYAFCTANVLNVINLNAATDRTIQVLDIQGRIITQQTVNNETMKLQLNLANGIYFVRVQGDRNYSNKFVVMSL